jgi:hypothetical protein
MVQLTMISNHLDLQGATLACHAQRLDSAAGFGARNTASVAQTVALVGGQGNGPNGGTGGTDGSALCPLPPHDHRVDLCN